MSAAMVECEGLVYIYKTTQLEVVALQGLDLRVETGEMVAIAGRSGSGKTTLMNILAGVDVPNAGKAVVAEQDLTRMTEGERDRYRHETVGYLLQRSQANLLAHLTALENVQLATLAGRPVRDERARHLLERFGLGDRMDEQPGNLDGGQKIRLALAVALANGPRLLLADEPTAELDTATAHGVLTDLAKLLDDLDTTAVFVTHDPELERFAGRVIQIRDGKTSTETRWTGSREARVADELVIMDRAGRIQLPRAYVEKLALKERVRVRLESDRISILPPDSQDGNNA
ncbi:MAG TPA: ABC transporter ATP-binding protein [Candidatus Dormibacteraeota bacterium]|nr:ABC transporter ATP-binding protein [Candidatus Dormibacteraeota bacterium]